MVCRSVGHDTPTYSAASCPDSHTVGEGRDNRSFRDARVLPRRDSAFSTAGITLTHTSTCGPNGEGRDCHPAAARTVKPVGAGLMAVRR